MKKSITWIFASIFLFGVSISQAQEQDSILTNYLRKAQYQQGIEYINTLEPTRNLECQKALCYKWLSNYSKAIEILEHLRENYPNDILIQLELAQCYENRLQYSQSIHCYEKLIETDSTNTYFQVRKADLLYRSEKYRTALENYLQIDPETYNPSYLKKSIALCYEKLNQPDSAKAYYQAAWELDANDIFSALSIVKLCIQQKDYAQALLHSETFLTIDTTNVQMNALNAFAYYNLDNYKEAVLRFEKCHAAGDSSLIVNRSLGISHFFLKNDAAAYPYLQQAYERDSTNMTVLYALAQVSHNLGYYPEAVQMYQKLIENALPNRNALYTYYNGLAQAYEKDNLFQDAAMYYSNAVPYASSNAQRMELFFNLSVLLEYDLKDYKMAVFYYTQYQGALLSYQESLLDQPDSNQEQIKEIEVKIDELSKHIRKLRTEHGIGYNDKVWGNN
ncbi:MAG: tetratricopeptide repeat protein [Dysgonamonadaceae bacterium]|jgi:tetratricopeptide (TPR) repeat protein|nr:tetratricopeptide repeat protein [Dysgonamonadaceae bacterium]